MTLTQLEYFLALAEHRSFSQAAKACGVTQPTLSAQFQKLEEELGHALVDRKAQPLVLTPMGQSLREQAAQTVQSAATIHSLVDQFEHPVAGVLRLGVVAPLASVHGAFWHGVLQAACPGVEMVWVEGEPAELQQQLLQAEVDAVLTQAESWSGQGQVFPLFQEVWWVLGPSLEAQMPSWSDAKAWLMGSDLEAATRYAYSFGWRRSGELGPQLTSVFGRANLAARTGKWMLVSESEVEMLSPSMQKRARPMSEWERTLIWVRGTHAKNEEVQARVRDVLAGRLPSGLRSAQ